MSVFQRNSCEVPSYATQEEALAAYHEVVKKFNASERRLTPPIPTLTTPKEKAMGAWGTNWYENDEAQDAARMVVEPLEEELAAAVEAWGKDPSQVRADDLRQALGLYHAVAQALGYDCEAKYNVPALLPALDLLEEKLPSFRQENSWRDYDEWEETVEEELTAFREWMAS